VPVPVNELWRLNTFISTAVSESSGEYTDRSNVTIESLKDMNNVYEISGRYTVPLSGKTHNYTIKINAKDEISYLSIDNKQIIS
jgi:hypothetical protein